MLCIPIAPPGMPGGIACTEPGDGMPGCGCIGGMPGDSGIADGGCPAPTGAPCGGLPGGGICGSCGICICGICGAIDCGGGCEIFISVCAIRSRWPEAAPPGGGMPWSGDP